LATSDCYPEKLRSFDKTFATKERKERKDKNLPDFSLCVPCVLLRQFSFRCGFATLGLCVEKSIIQWPPRAGERFLTTQRA